MNSNVVIYLGIFSAAVTIYALYLRSKMAERSDFSRKLDGSDFSRKLDDYPQKNTIWPKASGIDRQYQNQHVNMKDRHPVLEYQMNHDNGIIPASIGDNLRTPDIAGPISVTDPKMIRPDAPSTYGVPSGSNKYGSFGDFGPSTRDPRGMGVPVPNGALKFTNERYNKDQFLMNKRRNAPPPFPSEGPLPPPLDFYRPYGPNENIDSAPFFGSVNAYSPFPEILSPWEKAGILTSVKNDSILNLFRRAIAPLQDLWEYQVQDKDGFVIKLYEKYLEDGDVVRHIIGKEGLGPWKVHIFVQNKYIWV